MLWWKSVEEALENLGGVAPLVLIYREVHKVRNAAGATTPKSLNAIVRKELEYNSSDTASWNGSRDLFFSVHGIGQGVWGLRSRVVDPPTAADIDEPTDRGNNEREEATVIRIIRDTAMTRKVKALHDGRCQVCGDWIELPGGKRYVEAHHLIPLGSPHNGPDVASNILVVCPNHHAMLDYGCIELNDDGLRTALGHKVSSESIAYHNRRVYKPSE